MSKPDKLFEVEFNSSTYRTYKVPAQDAEAAAMKAYEELDMDCDASRAWIENAAVESIVAIEIADH